ncbi:Gfo/Idh/MocA family oxidoreductase [Chitinophaga pinensis]|uniref:Gfo/Idh/MocA family oxidoreductase n=1 Tax=Chitinophaga pinensis TaxID=79329 RepID=UPI0021BD0959|nr:Gfo/Idh/MocA family oxidoreductase [Chitinophaga pinensis]
MQQAQEIFGGGVKAFDDYRELIQLPEVDIVHIATPPHWHGIMSVEAARAGKDSGVKTNDTYHRRGERVKEATAIWKNVPAKYWFA